jgi:hypothetical protein
VTVTLDAVFTETVPESVSGMPWFIGLGYNPGLPLIGKDNAYFNKPFLPMGFYLKTGIVPWQGNWGKAGFLIDASYITIEALDTVSTSSSNISGASIGLGAFYRSPRLWNFMDAEAQVVFGITPFSAPLIQPGDGGNTDVNWENIPTWAFYLSPGLGLNFSLGNYFYLSLGGKLNLHLFSNGIIGLLSPYGGIGLQF